MSTKKFKFEYFDNLGNDNEIFGIDVKLNDDDSIKVWLDAENHGGDKIVFQIHTWYENIYLPDLSKFSEEELFQYSLINLNFSIEEYSFDIQLIKDIQIAIHEEYQNPNSKKIEEDVKYGNRIIKSKVRYIEVKCEENSIKVRL